MNNNITFLFIETEISEEVKPFPQNLDPAITATKTMQSVGSVSAASALSLNCIVVSYPRVISFQQRNIVWNYIFQWFEL